MAPKGDIRWNAKLILPTIILQFMASCAICGLSSAILDSTTSFTSLAISSASIVSQVIHFICFYTGSLHPLVVLTITIEFMILWLIGAVSSAVLFANDSSVGCKAQDDSDSDYDYRRSSSYREYNEAEMKQQRAEVCTKSTVLLVLVVIMTLSYLWLMVYSSVVRKKTAMPYVPREQTVPLMQQQEAQTGAIVQTGGGGSPPVGEVQTRARVETGGSDLPPIEEVHSRRQSMEIVPTPLPATSDASHAV